MMAMLPSAHLYRAAPKPDSLDDTGVRLIFGG
jgi:hypothetical protein